MSVAGTQAGSGRRVLAFASLAFAGACLVPYSSLTLIGPCMVSVVVLAAGREPSWSRWRFALLAAAGTFLGSAAYTLFTEEFYAFSGINVQAQESARMNRLLQLGLRLDPDRAPLLFHRLQWVGGACFYAVVSALLTLVFRRAPSGETATVPAESVLISPGN